MRCKIMGLGWLCLLLTGAAAVAGAEQADDGFGFEALMAAREQVVTERVAFRETRSADMLAEPQELSGTLVYRAPDYVRKSVAEPQRQFIEVMGERVVVYDGERERRLAVGDHPALTGIVIALRATLSGDGERVRDHYEVAFEGDRDSWEMTYTPLDDALAEHIERMVMSGQGAQIHVVETREAGGERREMRIRHGRNGGSG